MSLHMKNVSKYPYKTRPFLHMKGIKSYYLREFPPESTKDLIQPVSHGIHPVVDLTSNQRCHLNIWGMETWLQMVQTCLGFPGHVFFCHHLEMPFMVPIGTIILACR